MTASTAGLSSEEMSLLASAMDCILPSDDGPGASTAGAIGYAQRVIDREDFKDRMPCLVTGLDLLERMARAACGRGFAECDANQRNEFLALLQKVPHASVQRFFVTIVSMTVAGFLCDPDHGGNRGAVGWRFIRYIPHPAATGVPTE